MNFDDSKPKLATVRELPENDSTVAEINRLHQSFSDGLRTTLQIAIQIGELLVVQKAKCGHGKWIPWIEANLSFNRITAGKYMRCYYKRAKLNDQSTDHLTIEEFAKISAEPSEEERIAERTENPVKLEKPTTHQGKVTPEMREAMLKARANGLSILAIAKDFKLAKSTVHGVVKSISPSKPKTGKSTLSKPAKQEIKAQAKDVLSERLKALWNQCGHTLIGVETITWLLEELYNISSIAGVKTAQETWDVVRKELKLRGPEHSIKIRIPNL